MPAVENPLLQDVEPEFRDQCNAIYDSWRAGSLAYQVAVEQIEDLKGAAIQAGQFANQGTAELIMGIMQGYRANLDSSIGHFESARTLFERAGSRERVITCTLNIGESYRIRGNFTRARRYFRDAYEAARELGRVRTQVVALTNEGQMLVSLDRLNEARAALEKAYELSRNYVAETPREEREVLANEAEIEDALAIVLLRLGSPLDAWTRAMRSLKISGELGLPIRVGYANRVVGQIVTELGGTPDSAYSADPDEYFKASVEAFREVKAEGEMAKTLYEQGRSLTRRDKKMQAARLLQQAMVIFTRLGMVDDAAKAAEAQLMVL